ncbi:hypothetical protein J4Q44_G00094790 [Coregonus suidteri]|uniref:Uncharacterized protein n=1 Tax=Coregonus suidteri TaxID=861788 RepID=A0AAN8M3C4_9TELE
MKGEESTPCVPTGATSCALICQADAAGRGASDFRAGGDSATGTAVTGLATGWTGEGTTAYVYFVVFRPLSERRRWSCVIRWVDRKPSDNTQVCSCHFPVGKRNGPVFTRKVADRRSNMSMSEVVTLDGDGGFGGPHNKEADIPSSDVELT